MRMIIKPKFDDRNHDSMVNEYCSRFRARAAITPRSFERLYTDVNEIILAGESEPLKSVLQLLYERSGIHERAQPTTTPRRIQDVVVVPVVISFVDGAPMRMWSDDPSAAPPEQE